MTAGIDLLRAQIPPATVAKMAARELWQRGSLQHLTRPGAQRTAYDFVHACVDADPNSAAPIVLNIRRGGAKTVLLALLAWERCLSRPNQTALILGPTERQILSIIDPAMKLLFGAAPQGLRPAVSDGGRRYIFKNPLWQDPDAVSTLRVLGAKEDARHLRGFRADFVGLDELAVFDEPEYVVRSIVTPFFVGRADPIFVIATTPPDLAGHVFNTNIVPAAITDNRYLCIPGANDPAFTEQEERKMLSVFRSKTSTAWRREIGCELISDDDVLALPSFTANKSTIIAAHPRPHFFYPFVSADVGFVDATGVIFAYPDYEKQLLIVEDEIYGRSIGTTSLVSRIQGLESTLFADTPHYRRLRRFADATPRELDDLRRAGLTFTAARTGSEDRWDRATGLARLEAFCADNRLRIHPRCKSLIFQLSNAARNTNSTDLARDPTQPLLGHCDTLWALAYLLFNLQHLWLESPFPFSRGAPVAHANMQKYLSTRDGATHFTDRPLIITERDDHIS